MRFSEGLTHRQAANTAMKQLCSDCVATVRRLCVGCIVRGMPYMETQRLVDRQITVAAAAEMRSRILKRVEARIASTAAADRHAAAHRPRAAIRVWHAHVRRRALQCSALTHARSRQQRRSWAAWHAYTTAAPTLAGAVCIQRAWRHCAARARYKCAVMRLRAALRRHALRRLRRAWTAWRAYTTAKLTEAAGAVPAHRHTGTHMPNTACLAMAALPILLQAARRWQDTHAKRSGLPAPRQPLGTLSIWLREAYQQRSAQGERTEPDTHQLLGTVGFMLHTAQLQRNAHLDRARARALR